LDGLRRRFQLNFHNHARDSHMLLEVSMPRHNTGPKRLAAQASIKVSVPSCQCPATTPALRGSQRRPRSKKASLQQLAYHQPMCGVQRQSVNLGRQAGCWGGGGARAETEASGGTRLWQGGHAFLSGAHEERAQRRYVAVGVCIPLRAYGSMLGRGSHFERRCEPTTSFSGVWALAHLGRNASGVIRCRTRSAMHVKSQRPCVSKSMMHIEVV